MNAPLQQLFMIPTLRANLLAVDMSETVKTEQDKADSVVYQLQRMMSYLQESGIMHCYGHVMSCHVVSSCYVMMRCYTDVVHMLLQISVMLHVI